MGKFKHLRPSIDELLNFKTKYKTLTHFAKVIGVPVRTLNDWYHKAVSSTTPNITEPKTYVITCAQINTPVHKGFLENLKALVKDRNATLLIPSFTYNKNGLGLEEAGTGDARNKNIPDWYDTSIRKYLFNQRIELNEKVEVLGNLNILPTAQNPISGYQTFTGLKSAIIPHPKISFESVATASNKLTKFLVTSGAVTVPNYMQKNAGIKGEFHHQLGAVIVEVVNDKQFHLRHILAESDGSFYDLTERYHKGSLSVGHRVESIVWGDIHAVDLDREVYQASWYNDEYLITEQPALIDLLKPKHQFFHDLLDFKYRNHHNRKSDVATKVNYDKSVSDEIKQCVRFLMQSHRDYCTSVVVSSNHDRAYDRWITETPVQEEHNIDNALFLLRSQVAYYSSVLNAEPINLFKWACTNGGYTDKQGESILNQVKFLSPDESYRINEVECGMHGDKGINGAKGSLKSFAKIGTKCTIGHSHTAGIYEGVYQVGCSRTLNAGYNEGCSSWSHSHVIQYQNGKRAILTLINGRYYNHEFQEANCAR